MLELQYTWPILIVVFSTLLLGERLTVTRVGTLLGVVLVLKSGLGGPDRGDPGAAGAALVLIGSASFALFSVLSKAIRAPAPALAALYFFGATIVSVGAMAVFSELVWPTPRTVAAILVNGVWVNGFSYVFWQKALQHAEASFIAPFVSLTPVVGAVYVMLFFREPLTPLLTFGMLSVLFAGVLAGTPEPGGRANRRIPPSRSTIP